MYYTIYKIRQSKLISLGAIGSAADSESEGFTFDS